jgi:hypothetical protein
MCNEDQQTDQQQNSENAVDIHVNPRLQVRVPFKHGALQHVGELAQVRNSGEGAEKRPVDADVRVNG